MSQNEKQERTPATQSPDVQRVGRVIGEHLAEIAPLFKEGVKLTLLARCPDAPDGTRDLVLTNDTLGAAITALTTRHREESSRWTQTEKQETVPAPATDAREGETRTVPPCDYCVMRRADGGLCGSFNPDGICTICESAAGVPLYVDPAGAVAGSTTL
jgi:hypothetical protein